MAKQRLEVAVLSLVERVASGQRVEDALVECKSTFPDPGKTARRLAAHANAARGERILWIIGLDEDGHRVSGVTDELSTWWTQVEKVFADGICPSMDSLIVPLPDGQAVLALEFETDRAPYVVRNLGGGSPEREVPWREGNRTRSAHRHELLRLLLPASLPPAIEAVSAKCTARMIGAGEEEHIYIEVNTEGFFGPPSRGMVVLPLHQAQARVSFAAHGSGGSSGPTVDMEDISAWTTIAHGGFIVSDQPVPTDPPIDPHDVTVRRGAVYVGAPGLCSFTGTGRLPATMGVSVLRSKEVILGWTFQVAGGERPVRLEIPLTRADPTDGRVGQYPGTWVLHPTST